MNLVEHVSPERQRTGKSATAQFSVAILKVKIVIVRDRKVINQCFPYRSHLLNLK